MQLERETLSRQKDAVVLGTYESNAFVLSLRRRNEFSTTHSFGYHRVPHIGVYGSDYSLALPMALLSLPATPRYLEKLPQDVLSALDLGHLTGSLTAPPPPSPLHLLSQRIISNLHSHSGLSPDLQLRAIARELVKFSLASALTKLGLTTTHTLSGNIQVELSQQLNISSWQKHPQCGFEGTAFTSYERQVCNQDKRPSVVSLNSLSSMESEEPETSVLTSSRMLKTLSIQVEGTVIEEVEFEDEWREEEERRVEEDVLQLAAKKIVKKALHLACKKWESVNRRSSIDYLIASTKRLKIASPSPPPTLPEEEKVLYEYGVAASIRPPTGWDTSSPIPDASHGKKRSRSESHDIMMMKELEVFRKTQMMLGQNVGERVIAKPCRTAARGGGGKDRDSAFKRDSSPFHQQESMGDLISDIHRLCIQKADSESEECCSSEEDYTLLSGVTKPATSDSDTASPIPPPNSPTSLQVHRGGLNRCPSPLLQNMLPSALKQIPRWESYAGSSVDEEHVTCTSPEFQQKFSTMGVATASPSRDPFLIIPKDSPVPDMDYYIIVHTRPPPGLCQKFLCGNTNEVNLLYHCWLYPDIPCDSTVVCSEHLSMGVFQPRGVTPVHQDLQDAGVAFCTLQPRTVCIHSCHFSPENAQLQLLQNYQVHTFFSAARYGMRRVVALHVVPGSSEIEEALREGLGRCSTLGELLEQLSVTTPGYTEIIKNLVLP